MEGMKAGTEKSQMEPAGPRVPWEGSTEREGNSRD